MMREHLCRMARYNQWANARLYDACAALDEATYRAEGRMFFGSIHGTLNHLLVADRLWRGRILGEPKPTLKLDNRPFDDFASLRQARVDEDRTLIDLTESYTESDLDADISYRMATLPEDATTPLHLCWLHLFNHQTHHRGQIHDQLTQTDVPPPPLDLIFYLREHG